MNRSDGEESDVNWKELAHVLSHNMWEFRANITDQIIKSNDKNMHRDLFRKLSDYCCQTTIEFLPREETARLLINCIEQYQHKHPISNGLIPGKHTVRETHHGKSYEEVNNILRRLREDLRIALSQKELELEMREGQLVQLKQETINHYTEFLNQT